MRIGITYDLKADAPLSADLPDDYQEEFDSPATIAALAGVLRGLGHEVDLLGDGRELLERLLRDPPDFVFNIAEGRGVGRSREARVPAVLEMLGIPYSGSDPLTLAATLDKDCAKRLVQSAGLTVPAGLVLQDGDDHWTKLGEYQRTGVPLFPAIVKPAWEGSSKGIRSKCLAHGALGLDEIVSDLRRDYRQPILVERYIPGDELTVGIVGNDQPHIIGILRVVPLHTAEPFIYSLEVKRDYQRQVRYECLRPERFEAVAGAALRAYRALGCRDVSRLDFRWHNGTPYFLEANPLPGLNPESSDLVILSRLAGWSYEQLIESILRAALARTGLASCNVTAATTATT